MSQPQTKFYNIGRSRLLEYSVLGTGYSGEVKKVEDDNGCIFALKVSNDKIIRFTLTESVPSGNRMSFFLPEAAEFEKLRKLYRAGIPVPRPYAFQIYTNAAGIGNTAILMDIVRGLTLRDWLSVQPDAIKDRISGRTTHPVTTYKDALTRIDVAITIIKSLLKLRKVAFFADFKPRNVMLKESLSPQNVKQFSTVLVDVGGTVLYHDVASSGFYDRIETEQEDQSVLYFHPLKDRFLIETTCSYLSPELAFLISEYDFWKMRLQNHYFHNAADNFVSDKNVESASKVHSICALQNSHLAAYTNLDYRLFYSYLGVRSQFKKNGVLQTINSLNDIKNIKLSSQLTDQNNDCCVSNLDLFSPPHLKEYIRVSEKSNVFTMGLILTELFGGRRTGLTSLSRIQLISELFENELHNAEFRMVLEWEQNNNLLSRIFNSTTTHKTLNSEVSLENMLEEKYAHTISASTSAESMISNCWEPGNEKNNSMYVQYDNSSDVSKVQHQQIGANTFFNVYRCNSYPTKGILSVPTCENIKYRDPLVQPMVLNLLDKCLRGNPTLRPTLTELLGWLYELRGVISRKFTD